MAIFYFYIFLLLLQLQNLWKKKVEISGRDEQEVRVPACPHRIRPLGALLECGQFEDSSLVDRKISRGQKE
jgi:hypothetical protein